MFILCVHKCICAGKKSCCINRAKTSLVPQDVIKFLQFVARYTNRAIELVHIAGILFRSAKPAPNKDILMYVQQEDHEDRMKMTLPLSLKLLLVSRRTAPSKGVHI